MRIVALVLLCLPVGIFWLASLHLVSQAGIQRPLRRAAVFVVLLPGATIAFIGMPLAAIGLLQAVAEPHHFGNRLATISWQTGGSGLPHISARLAGPLGGCQAPLP